MYVYQFASPEKIIAVVNCMEQAAMDKDTDDETSIMLCRLVNRITHVGVPFEQPLTKEEKEMIAVFLEMV
jgi:hypothetical protein